MITVGEYQFEIRETETSPCEFCSFWQFIKDINKFQCVFPFAERMKECRWEGMRFYKPVIETESKKGVSK